MCCNCNCNCCRNCDGFNSSPFPYSGNEGFPLYLDKDGKLHKEPDISYFPKFARKVHKTFVGLTFSQMLEKLIN